MQYRHEWKHEISVFDVLCLRIAGGTITVTAPSDTIHVNDSLHITSASLTLSAGDDALHSDTSIAILGGGITVNSCSEGIEVPEIFIEDGDITVTSTDDGINACGTETADGSLPGVTINGGTVTLLNPSGRDADGIDSNGNIDINGGLVYISLVGDGSNCALDYGSENGCVCRINGGTVVACGGSTMLETMSETSAQPSLLYAGATQAAGTEISLQAADGKTLLTFAAPNSFSAVLVSCPEMQLGSTYTLTLGATSQEFTLTQVADSYGVSGGMGQGGGPGGMDSGINGQGAPGGRASQAVASATPIALRPHRRTAIPTSSPPAIPLPARMGKGLPPIVPPRPPATAMPARSRPHCPMAAPPPPVNRQTHRTGRPRPQMSGR